MPAQPMERVKAARSGQDLKRDVCLALVVIAWTVSANAELNDEVLASFLPPPQSEYTMDAEAMESNRPDQGIWASAVYRGNSTFVLSVERGTPASANLLALVNRLTEIEVSSDLVDVGGVKFVVLGAECFAALPGEVVISCSSFTDDTRSHLETIDFEALTAAALDSP
jgi:hypothetical protein